MLKHALSVVGFFVATVGVQATNHFILNVDHYSGQAIINPEPILWSGLLTVIIQGLLLTLLYKRTIFANHGWKGGLYFSWVMGLFLGVYIAMAEPSKYLVEDRLSWFLTEASASFVQFTLFGLVLGGIHSIVASRSGNRRELA